LVSSVNFVNAQTNGDSEATSIPERTNEVTGQYAAAARQLAGELSLPVVDLWTEVQKHKGWQSEYLEDGLHFTPAGQKAVFDLLLDAIRKALPHLRCVSTNTLSIWMYVQWENGPDHAESLCDTCVARLINFSGRTLKWELSK